MGRREEEEHLLRDAVIISEDVEEETGGVKE